MKDQGIDVFRRLKKLHIEDMCLDSNEVGLRTSAYGRISHFMPKPPI